MCIVSSRSWPNLDTSYRAVGTGRDTRVQEVMMFTRITRCASPPVFEGQHEKTRSALLLYIILWMFISAATAYGVFAPIDPQFVMRRVVIIAPFVIILF